MAPLREGKWHLGRNCQPENGEHLRKMVERKRWSSVLWLLDSGKPKILFFFFFKSPSLSFPLPLFLMKRIALRRGGGNYRGKLFFLFPLNCVLCDLFFWFLERQLQKIHLCVALIGSFKCSFISWCLSVQSGGILSSVRGKMHLQMHPIQISS